MNEEQSAIYIEAVQAAPPGLLRTLDASVLETWVIARAVHQQCVKALAQTGLVVRGPKGVVRNPYVVILNMQAKELIRAAAELGFTPSSRSRVKVEKQKQLNRFAHLKTQA
jgi:P27 family predicted phage terminase small subunit